MGNYFADSDCSLDITPQVRSSMIELIEQLTEAAETSSETFFTAVSIADRYLAIQAVY